MEVVSRAQARLANTKRYFTGKPCVNGHISERTTSNAHCVACQTDHASQWMKNNVDAARRLRRESYHRHPVPKAIKTRRNKLFYKQNRQARLERSAEWKRNNPKLCRLYNAKRRAAKLRCTPKWVDQNEIREFYLACPNGMQVDHIVPLQHTLVCGLHVIWNLQYLTDSDNASKGNKLII